MSECRYCYPKTEVLINRRGILSQEELDKYERQVTLDRIYSLEKNPTLITGEFNLDRLMETHTFIFGEVYPASEKEFRKIKKEQGVVGSKRYFVGQLRDEDIFKGFTRFIPAKYLKESLESLFFRLKEENYLIGLTKDQISVRLAFYMAELNILHPFREGNGRSTRIFISQLALQAGYQLNWSKINPAFILNAVIKSVTDTEMLEKVICGALD